MMNAMEVTDEERAMIEEARAEKADWKPFLEEDYTAREKCEAFDRLHAMALEEFERRIAGGHAGSGDMEHYIYEAAMELLGKDVWDVLNASV